MDETNNDAKNNALASLDKRLAVLERAEYLNKVRLADTYSLALLHPLLSDLPFIPFTGASLRPFCLAHIINDIVINGRKHIIEFGSGVSTVVIGRLMKMSKLASTLISIEHNQAWVEVLNSLLAREDLHHHVKVIWVPLATSELTLDANKWYDTKILEEGLSSAVFDMVIVDGPPAWETGKGKARYPALPFIYDKLSERCSVYLDDAERAGEREVLALWHQRFPFRFTITGNTLAFACRGESFYTEPLAYSLSG
jgi:predicted O-methyltransferase YrrM